MLQVGYHVARNDTARNVIIGVVVGIKLALLLKIRHCFNLVFNLIFNMLLLWSLALAGEQCVEILTLSP